jgi:hypothetical protein
MDEITITVPRRWIRLVHSPVMLLVAALTGISVSFVPLTLFELGRAQADWDSPGVWLCFLVLYLVPGFYMGIAARVLGQVRKLPRDGIPSTTDSAPVRSDGRHSTSPQPPLV